MTLINQIIEFIDNEFKEPNQAEQYILKWYEQGDGWYGNYGNFEIIRFDNSAEMDKFKTLHGMDGEILLKIAVDLGIETPDFIPSVATFKNELKSSYKTAYSTFEKAFKQINTHPDIAVGLANSALESIIKEILKDERLNATINSNKTLYDLTSDLLKSFQLFPGASLPQEIKTIGSSLLSINQSIEKLRSTKTNLHGKTAEDYVIKDAIYGYFIVNSVSTVGFFLDSYYRTMFPKETQSESTEIDLPF